MAGCGAQQAWILLSDTRAEELQRSEESPQLTRAQTPPSCLASVRPSSAPPQLSFSLSSSSCQVLN